MALALFLLPTLIRAEEAGISLRQITTDGADIGWGSRMISLVGMAVIVGIGVLLSSNWRAINWRTIGWGLGLQLGFGVLVLRTDVGRGFFSILNDLVSGLLRFSD